VIATQTFDRQGVNTIQSEPDSRNSTRERKQQDKSAYCNDDRAFLYDANGEKVYYSRAGSDSDKNKGDPDQPRRKRYWRTLKSSRPEFWQAIFSLCLVVSTIFTVVYLHWQKKLTSEGLSKLGDEIWAAKDAAFASKKASDTARDTLVEIRTGQGSIDTHNLAQAAGDQAKATSNLAEAARDQASSTSKIFASEKNVNRAWIAVKSAEYIDDRQTMRMCATCPAREDHFIQMRLQLTNYGRTTAVHVKFKPSYWYMEVHPRDTIYSEIVNFPKVEEISIVPGADAYFSYAADGIGIPLDENWLNNLKHGNKKLIFTGDFDYWDVYQRPQWYHYCFYIDYTYFPPTGTTIPNEGQIGNMGACTLKDNMSYQDYGK
jgi:hypothetical protein